MLVFRSNGIVKGMSVKRPLFETVPGATEDYNHIVLKRKKMNCFGLGRNGKEEQMELDTGVASSIHATSSIETAEQLFASLNRMSEDVERVMAFLRIPNLEGYKEFVVGYNDTNNNGREFRDSVIKDLSKRRTKPSDKEHDSLFDVLPALYDKIKKLYPEEFPSKYLSFPHPVSIRRRNVVPHQFLSPLLSHRSPGWKHEKAEDGLRER